ncbi:MAG: hypothetical protein EBQ96_09795, partial [Proteobacteria bacterium]|nr:hypothetical protein [Pseudomonadota bacterium]
MRSFKDWHSQSFHAQAYVNNISVKFPAAKPVLAPQTPSIAATNTVTDPLVGNQWHIKNANGVDTDVTRVWDNYKGAGIKIGIIDDGFDLNHADLRKNYNLNTDYDFANNDTDASAMAGNNHGTAVAGVIAADDNGIGLVGIAPDAEISGLRVSFGSAPMSVFENAMRAAKNFDVVNNSWGFTQAFSDNFNTSQMAGMRSAIQDAVTAGRGGLGTNIVFAAGNSGAQGDNVNYHNMQNSSHTIAVGAFDSSGKIASFSTPGSAVLVSAAGVNVATTDVTGGAGYSSGDYASANGTSFAAPIVTGVIALMLNANASLGYRDVQEILAYSSRKTDASNPEWQNNGAKNWNGQGLHYSHSYGFGAVDAHTAVRLAETWGTGKGTAATLQTVAGSSTQVVSIPDGTSFAASTINIAQNISVDRVEVTLNISHSMASQLDVVLVSPSGTKSVLLDNAPVGTLPTFTFNTVANWGESSTGNWTLQVFDRASGTVGQLNGWSMKILGDTATTDSRYFFTDEFKTTGTGTHTIVDADGGNDILNASAMTNSIILNLATRTGTFDGRAVTLANGTTLETVLTGDGNDTITGDSLNNTIRTGRGNDIVNASAGQDIINGGAGTDTYVLASATNMTLAVLSNGSVQISNKVTKDMATLTEFEQYSVAGKIYDLNGLKAVLEGVTATPPTTTTPPVVVT